VFGLDVVIQKYIFCRIYIINSVKTEVNLGKIYLLSQTRPGNVRIT